MSLRIRWSAALLIILPSALVGCADEQNPATQPNATSTDESGDPLKQLAKDIAMPLMDGMMPFLEELANQNPELLSAQGISPLHNAVSFRKLEEVRALLKAGADAKASDRDGRTPLHYATLGGKNERIVDLLLRHGADPNTPDSAGNTPLHNATLNAWSDEKIAALLLRYDADPNKSNAIGNTPLLSALGGNPFNNTNRACVELFLKAGADVRVRNNDGRGPLSLASEHGGKKTIQRMIEAGDDVNQVDSDGWVPLHYAAVRNSPDVLQLLVTADARTDARTQSGHSAMFLAANRGCRDTLHLLDEYRSAEPTWTDLIWAAIWDKKEEAQKALDAKQGIDHKDCYGRTPLVWAARCGSSDVAKMLIDKGADVKIGDADGFTAFLGATSSGNLAIMKLLKDRGADIHAVDKDGWNALFFAVAFEDTAILQWLIHEGLDIHSRDNAGATLLHHAAQSRYDNAFAVLMKAGVDPFLLDNEGHEPLEWADSFHRDKLKKLVTPYRSRMQEAMIDAVLAARKNGTLPKSNAGEADSPKAAVLQLIRAINQGDSAAFTECFVADETSRRLLPEVVNATETSLRLRQAIIDAYGIEGWVTLQTNDNWFHMTIPIVDEAVVETLSITQVDADTATCHIPNFDTPGPVQIRRIGKLWKLDTASLVAPGADVDALRKLMVRIGEDTDRAIKQVGKPGMTAEKIDELMFKYIFGKKD